MSPHSIENVETVALEASLSEPFGSGTGWFDTRSALLVRAEAEDGTVGWGECWGPIAGNRELIEEYLAPFVEGRDPMNVERIYDALYGKCRGAYKATVPLAAISGIDIALWDLKGKLMGTPVSNLLGGRTREKLDTYATGHYFKYGADLEGQYELIAAEAEENAERYGAVKAKIGLETLGYGYEEDIELVRRIREAIGDDTRLMIDANCKYDVATAREVGRALEELGVFWYEEPLHPENVAGYAQLRDDLEIRIAAGESHRPSEFDRLFDSGGIDVAQPDACILGGLTPTRRVASVAIDHNCWTVPHVWGTSVALAVSLQLLSTLEDEPLLEFDTSPNPVRDVAKTSIEPTDGVTAVPEGDGIGIEIDREKIEPHRV